MTPRAVRMHLPGNQNPDDDYDDILMMLCLVSIEKDKNLALRDFPRPNRGCYLASTL